MQIGETIQVAAFDRPTTAQRAVNDLLDAGFEPDRVQVVAPTAPEEAFRRVVRFQPPAESATSFAVAGGAVGSIVGGLIATAGIAATGGAGVLALGPVVGAAAAGGAAGSFLGLMSTRGLAPEIADYHDQALRHGQAVVGVEPAHQAGQPSLALARDILARHGGETAKLPDAS